MNRLKILMLQFQLNIVLNTFFIVECVLAFLLLNSVVSTLLYDGYVGKYVGFDADTTFFLSGAVKNNVEFGEPEAFYQLVEEIRSLDGVAGVGYQMNESFLSGKNDDLNVKTFILSQDMLQIRYPLRQGEWFDSQATSETQVILGGDIAALYEIGEIITLHKLETVRGALQYIPVKVQVIGKMRDPAFAINLNFSSTQPEYVNMFEPYQNIIISNDPALISPDGIQYPLMSLLVFADPDADPEKVRQELSIYGQPFDFHEVDAFYREALENKIANALPTTGLMVIGVLFGIIGMTYLGIHRNMKSLSVYYLYGMSRKGCAFVNALLNTAMLTVSLLLSVLLYYVPSIHDNLFLRSLIGPYNFIFSLAFIAIALGVSLAVSCRFSRKSPVATLRRFE